MVWKRVVKDVFSCLCNREIVDNWDGKGGIGNMFWGKNRFSFGYDKCECLLIILEKMLSS